MHVLGIKYSHLGGGWLRSSLRASFFSPDMVTKTTYVLSLQLKYKSYKEKIIK